MFWKGEMFVPFMFQDSHDCANIELFLSSLVALVADMRLKLLLPWLVTVAACVRGRDMISTLYNLAALTLCCSGG